MRRKLFTMIVLLVFGVSTPWAAASLNRIGWQAELATHFHGVSGTVTIVDEDTFRVDNFNYDGAGLAVYFYLGVDNTDTAFQNGLAVGSDLVGPPFVNASMVLDLPPGETLDGYNAISVWCVPATASFGDGEFGEIVQYQVTFDANWNPTDHPTDYPATAHWSGLIGATHNSDVTFWMPFGLASQAIENMAELGSKTAYFNEVNAHIEPAHAGDAFGVISGDDITTGVGSASKTFSIRTTHPLVTLNSMIAPSPDWFVGVYNLRLYEYGQWRRRVQVQLVPWDAGTEDGTTFSLTNPATVPPEPISRILGSPFDGTPPLGTFTFELVGSCPYLVTGDLNADCRIDLLDLAVLSCQWLIDCNVTPDDPACYLLVD